MEEAFRNGRSIEKLGSNPALDEAVMGLKEGEVWKTPIKVGDTWVIVGVTRRKEADLAEFAKQRDQLTETALRDRQDQVYEDYVTAAIDRMKKAGKIKIYDEVFNSIEEDEPEIAPQPSRRIPIPTGQ